MFTHLIDFNAISVSFFLFLWNIWAGTSCHSRRCRNPLFSSLAAVCTNMMMQQSSMWLKQLSVASWDHQARSFFGSVHCQIRIRSLLPACWTSLSTRMCFERLGCSLDCRFMIYNICSTRLGEWTEVGDETPPWSQFSRLLWAAQCGMCWIRIVLSYVW